MNVVLFGCKDTTLHLAKFLFKLGLKIDLITISPTKAKINKVAGYLDLTLNSDLFSSINVVENYNLKNPNDLSNIKKIKNLKLGFCMGWQRLISEEILNCFDIGIFGMHGSSRGLPYGKGRSPMNWAMEAFNDVFLRGDTLTEIISRSWSLWLFAAICFGLALVVENKR